MLRNSTPGGAQVLVEKSRKLGCWMGCLASGVSWYAEVLERQVMEASSCYVLLSGREQGNTSGRSHGEQGT